MIIFRYMTALTMKLINQLSILSYFKLKGQHLQDF